MARAGTQGSRSRTVAVAARERMLRAQPRRAQRGTRALYRARGAQASRWELEEGSAWELRV